MPYFAMPYRVLFHDTMAYGSHHYLSNFKFQNIARETILFDSSINGQSVWEEQLKNMVLLTREAYSLNLAPVSLGQKVGILLSYEEPTRSTVRLCFRVLRQDGQPVSCGYQTMICVDKDTLEPVPAPPMVTQYLDPRSAFSLIEKLSSPSFADRLKGGSRAIRDIFSDEVVKVGKYIANRQEREGYPRIIDEDLKEIGAEPPAEFPRPRTGIVFTFPGQGSFDPRMLRELREAFPETSRYFQYVEKATREILNQEFLSAIDSLSSEARDRIPPAHSDAAQVGIYLAGALVAKILIDRGIQPDVLLGHSVGELAALATAGVYSIESGVDLVCQRILALRSAGARGGMAAISCGCERAAEILGGLGAVSAEIAVVNHARQTVLSGPLEELESLREILARHGVSLTKLESPYPFHSAFVAPAVEPFRRSLSAFRFSPAKIPVYHCTEKAWFSGANDLARILSRQLITRLDFAGIVSTFRENGYATFVECGAGDIVTQLVRKNFPESAPVTALPTVGRGESVRSGVERVLTCLSPDSRKPLVVEEKPLQTPVAIVAMGCVLPNAGNPDQYWGNILAGISGIADLAAIDPGAAADFVAGSVDGELNIVPDKTYTLLAGSILDIQFDAATLHGAFTQGEFERLTRGQKLLALALGQSLSGGLRRARAEGKVQCILGATADGSSEFDDATFADGVLGEVAALDEPAQLRTSFARAVEKVCGYRREDVPALSQQRIYSQVVDRFIPRGANTYVIDTACSSSLYAVNLGIKALLRGDSDLILAGGVFAPGPANSPLFAQFRGLSSTGSRPFDKDADGVVFGDGAAVLALKRLPDALADGDKVIAVIRGIGLSSDGKSPSINVPQAKGQSLAVCRALRQADIGTDSIQYIEAHATATPVGDKVEIESLINVFGDRSPEAPKIELGSVKALIGHTGWVSGAASIIKICKAFQARTIPRQYSYKSADPAMGLDRSPFMISTESHAWAENRGGYPRRAGVNGFGFGGTNAHILIEEFVEDYHRRLCRTSANSQPRERPVIVGIGSLFPRPEGLAGERPASQRKFQRSALRLPRKKILLPDVTDHMDASQYLVSLAAEEILNGLPEDWTKIREEIGMVLGLEGKTERGIGVNKRILLDRLARLLRQRRDPGDIPASDAQRILGKLANRIRGKHLASGPYTLPGLMPNVTASRVCNLFDLKGPNMVIDKCENSLLQSLMVAEQLLESGDCKMVLAGGVNALNREEESFAEAALLVAVTTEAIAKERGFPILAPLEVVMAKVNGAAPAANGLDYRAATGAVEILAALDRFRHSATPVPPPEHSKTYAYVQSTPIYRCTPALVRQAAENAATSLKDRRILFLTDQPEEWSALCKSGALDALKYQVACPSPLASGSGLVLDLESEERLTTSLGILKTIEYDTVLAVKFLKSCDGSCLLDRDWVDERGLLDLLFAVCRQDYEDLRGGQRWVASLSMAAFEQGEPHPSTGLTAGFLKSLSREIPEARVAIVNTDESNFLKALRQVEIELGQPGAQSEVCYLDRERHVFRLRRQQSLASDGRPYLDRNSVVLATGGGRGVTAALAEELLSRYGCTVVAAGRTNLGGVPQHILEMDDASFREYEARFYQEELARDRSQKIRELKRKFASYQAANEVSQVIRQMRVLPGVFDYRSVDLSEPPSVERLVEDVYKRYGRIDLVLHGAGLQLSGMLTKKSLGDFRSIVAAKMASLGYIYRAVNRRRNNRPVHYHLLTSAFSYMGNDGQPDYGAANEALNRVAAVMNDAERGVYWSSMGWLGWAGIGMTRGSEFAALAASRRLRGVTREEGRELFAEMMSGTPSAAINILLADGEIRHYGVTVDDTAPEAKPSVAAAPRLKREDTVHWNITLDSAPFLLDHVVNGTPTLPAAFLTCMVADAAKKLRPDLHITAYEDTHYYRFVRVPQEGGAQVRVHTLVISEDELETAIRVQVLSDFVHKSGRVLQTNIVHNETVIRMSKSLGCPPATLFEADRVDGLKLPDPYVIPGSNVKLNGQFVSTRDIEVGSSRRIARYKLASYRYPKAEHSYLIPNMILVDAFWRFGTVRIVSDQRLGVYVPERCGVMRVYFDYVAFDSPKLLETFTFRGTNPEVEGDLLHVGPIEVSDARGNVLLVVERGVCRKFGEVDLASSIDMQESNVSV